MIWISVSFIVGCLSGIITTAILMSQVIKILYNQNSDLLEEKFLLLKEIDIRDSNIDTLKSGGLSVN